MSRSSFSLLQSSAGNPSLFTLIRELRSTLRGCQTALDVGCGSGSPLRFVTGVHLVGMDGYPPALEEARQLGTHDEYVSGNVLELGTLFGGRKFDACVALDVIEHLHKEDGWRMLANMEKLASRRVVILTPNGFLPQKSHDGDLQEHLSGWTAQELTDKGYKVLGMYGPKSIRGEYHHIVRQPRILWLAVSLLAHFFHTRGHPEKSAAILCIKNVAG